MTFSSKDYLKDELEMGNSKFLRCQVITECKTRPTLIMCYERPHKGVKASANSDVKYFFTSAQVGDPSQDDVRLCLDDDLKKAQDHSQSQA
ncbi:hypothetical protein Tco_0411593 [Tanacetum coccineum]